MISDRLRVLAERISKGLSISGNKFIAESKSDGSYLCINVHRMLYEGYDNNFLKYPVKTQDRRELGLMYIDGDLCSVYFDGDIRIKWPDDWIDPYPVFINKVELTADYVEVKKGWEYELRFICLAYYAVDISSEDLINRDDRMKLARFTPAAVKDFNILLRLLDETCDKYGIDKSEVKLDPYSFNCSLKFNIANMSDDEIVDETLMRAEALAEVRRRFREWLPSEERRNYYEETMLFPEDPFRRRFRIPCATPAEGFSWSRFEGEPCLCKWPYKSGDPERDKERESALKRSFLDFQSITRFYDLDGNRLRLARKTDRGLKFLGRVTRNGLVRIGETELSEKELDREDIVIAVDRRMKKLPKIPLEKIGFLKEDFPELWKS